VSAFSIDDVIADATPVERVVPVCVAGKLVGEYEQLKAELERVQGAITGRLGGSASREIIARLRELEGQMKAKTYDFRFRALPAKGWSDLMSAHPDKAGKLRFNADTFPAAAILACCVEPALDDPAKAEALLASLSAAQQNELFDGAWEVNSSAPKGMNSFTAFADLQDFAKSSDSAPGTESPAADSSAA
jgi:hypothetical protein